MTIVVHHLEHSRSIRALWLLEELGLSYTLKTYQRTKRFRAPPELSKVHPLGRAPVVEVDGEMLAESGAIIEYFAEREGQLRPEGGSALLAYRFFLHYAEGSAMPPLLVQLIVERIKKTKAPFFVKPIIKKIADGVEEGFTREAIDTHFGFVNDTLGAHPYFAGDDFSGADIQMYYACEAARSRGGAHWPNIDAWITRVTAREAFARALDKGGPAIPKKRSAA
ncbi:MAG: glutathione S-transferase [Deltaproteobacteria bacterium]|jgi:glutathione S-transferase